MNLEWNLKLKYVLVYFVCLKNNRNDHKKITFFTESFFGFKPEWRGFVFQVISSRDRNLDELSLRARFSITKQVLSVKSMYCAAVRFNASRSSLEDRLQS